MKKVLPQPLQVGSLQFLTLNETITGQALVRNDVMVRTSLGEFIGKKLQIIGVKDEGQTAEQVTTSSIVAFSVEGSENTGEAKCCRIMFFVNNEQLLANVKDNFPHAKNVASEETPAKAA